MTGITEFNAAANADTEREHDIQLGLLRELCRVAGAQGDPAVVGEILARLIDYSEAHFASEELLMRMKSYDDYEDHVEDHAQMLDTLRGIAADHARGESALVAGRAAETLDFIGKHIATRDRRFADCVRNNL
ncbi:MAG: hemerythrin family protein [Rhodocyclales bacterium]|nr:hemerythrin family protein [Rhodocyclales bacterium]